MISQWWDGMGSAAKRSMSRVLIAEDDELCASFMRDLLEREGFHVVLRAAPPAVVKELREGEFDLLIIDFGMNAAGILESVHTSAPDTPVLVVSGYPEYAIGEALEVAGVADFLPKPFTYTQFIHRVRVAIGGVPQMSKGCR